MSLKVLFLIALPLIKGQIMNAIQQNYPNQLNSFEPLVMGFKEELVIEEVDEVSDFMVGDGVKKWLHTDIGPQSYLLGLRENGVNLVMLYSRNDERMNVHEDSLDINGTVTGAVMFKNKSPKSNTYEGYVVVSISSPDQFMWFRISNLRLEQIATWDQKHKAVEIIHFKFLKENRLLVIEEDEGKNKAILYGFSIASDEIHHWFLESMLLPIGPIQGSVLVKNDNVNLFVLQKSTGDLKYYNYNQFCTKSTLGKFEYTGTMPTIGNQMTPFVVKSKTFIVVSGEKTELYELQGIGMKYVASLGARMEVIVLRALRDRDDIIVLAKDSAGDVSMFKLNTMYNKWERKHLPNCLKSTTERIVAMKDCIGGARSWKGATYLNAGTHLLLIFADRKEKGELYNLNLALKPTLIESEFNDYWMKTLDQEMESSWMQFRSSFKELSSRRAASDGWESLCSLSHYLDDLSNKVTDTKLRLNTVDCSAENNSKSRPAYEIEDEKPMLAEETKQVTIEIEENESPETVIDPDVDNKLKTKILDTPLHLEASRNLYGYQNLPIGIEVH